MRKFSKPALLFIIGGIGLFIYNYTQYGTSGEGEFGYLAAILAFFYGIFRDKMDEHLNKEK